VDNEIIVIGSQSILGQPSVGNPTSPA